MKSLLIACTVVLLTGVYAQAQEVRRFAGCTKDSSAVSVKANLDEHASKQAVEDISKAFKETAAVLNAEELLAYDPGYVTFVGKLSEEDQNAIVSIERPVVIGRCDSKQ